jgi:hypothetical protein
MGEEVRFHSEDNGLKGGFDSRTRRYGFYSCRQRSTEFGSQRRVKWGSTAGKNKYGWRTRMGKKGGATKLHK